MEKAVTPSSEAQFTAEEIEKIQAGLDSIETKPLLTPQEVRELARARTKAWKQAAIPKKSA